MDTRDGRIFEPDEMQAALHEEFLANLDPRDRARMLDSLKGSIKAKGETFESLRQKVHTGQVVPVSDQVAQTMKVGQRELDRRKRRRAQKHARKQNRR